MVATCYEELEAWMLANELKKGVYALIRASPAVDDFRFRDQTRAAAASATANLAEGFGYFRHPEFAKHARIACASLEETHNHLGDGVDRGYWSADDAAPLRALAERARKASNGLAAYLERTPTPKSRPPAKPRRPGTTDPVG